MSGLISNRPSLRRRVAEAMHALFVGTALLVPVVLSGCTTGEGISGTGVPPSKYTSWERTDVLNDRPQVDDIDDGSMRWTLTREKTADQRVCWTARIASGPEILSSIEEIGDFCSFQLDRNAVAVQFPFVQASNTEFAKADSQQTVAGVADDRLDQATFIGSDGGTVVIDVDADGSFIAKLPLGFTLDHVTFEGDGLKVVCTGKSVDALSGGQCRMQVKK